MPTLRVRLFNRFALWGGLASHAATMPAGEDVGPTPNARFSETAYR